MDGTLELRGPNTQSRYFLFVDVLSQTLRVLPAALAKLTVTADSSDQIVVTFAMTRQIDASRYDVRVHQVVDHTRLDVTLVSMHQHLLT